MKNILVSSALALTAYCLLASASATAQDFTFPSIYARPAEIVDGIDVGSRVDFFAPATGRSAKMSRESRVRAAPGRSHIAPHRHRAARGT